MRIKILRKKTKLLKDFWEKEWEYADVEHWGRHTRWEEKVYFIKALEKGKVLGLLEMCIQAGVAKIKDVIIAHNHRREGVGRKLMLEAEKLAKENKAHKIYLITGKDWISEKFYKSIGYEVTGTLKKHFFQLDFIQFSKFL
jgi:ribosomal protein S18 acetylase RimI-like enzyme